MKKIISLILVFAICLTVSSCTVNLDDFSLMPAEKKKSAVSKYLMDNEYLVFLDKLELFAAKLTYEVYSDSNKQTNVCISPLSVYMALALAIECTNGETREEMLNAVGVSYDEVKEFTEVLYAFSNREYYYTNVLNEKKILAFEELANSIWVDDSVTLKQDCMNSLADDFNCDQFGVDFSTAEGERAINAYIKEKTHGIIDANIDLSPKTLVTIINTFYLKEVWNDVGNDLSFTDKAYNFKNADGSLTNTKLLRGYYFEGKVYEGDGYTSFYTSTDHGFDIKFILPDEGRTLDDVFTAENLYDINNLGNYGYIDEENKLLHHTRVFFPEYKASYDGDLAGILRDDFGISKLFNFEQCDFSNLTDEQIACEGVIHKCSLDVNKKGIEGAAVTVMPNAGAAGPLEGYEEVYHDYIVDRAFGFLITDSNGTVLFSGVVNNIK